MLRPGVAMAILAAWIAPAHGADGPGPKPVALRFLEGLRERGYYDLALGELERLRQSPSTPNDLKDVLDLETGRTLLEEAAGLADLERRRQQLDQARVRLEAFTRDHPDHPQAPEALVQLARLLVERGHVAAIQADEAQDPADKQSRLAEARAAFRQARDAYGRALEPLKAAFEAFPKFIPNDDPRFGARERAHVALMNADLQRALVDYEEAQTYPPGSEPRNPLLDGALQGFRAIYQAYRTQLAGLYARMWQGKCHEEKGELGPAMGIYNELMEHGDPRLRDLQRQVGYFRIIIIGKRDEHALAADEAARWLQANPSARRSNEGLGVQLELARNILAQVEKLRSNDRETALRRAIDLLTEVVRYYSPHKPEALALLKEHRPSAARSANIAENLSFDDAMSQADMAIASEDWGRAIALIKAAVRRADPAREPETANRARYLMAFCFYKDGRYYEADVVAEHLARRYPREGLSPKATEIGMAALTFAYNTYTRRDQASDLARLIDLCQFTAATWSDSEPADTARTTLGEIFLGQGRYIEAASAFESVRDDSPRRPDALDKAGVVRWRRSQALRAEGKTAEADAEAKAAEALLKDGLRARRDAGVPNGDPAKIGNACDLADLYLSTGRAEEALNQLEPMVKALGKSSTPAASRLLATRLRAHGALGQVDEALADMKRLEEMGGPGDSLTQLYYQLGRLLEGEMSALRAKGDEAGFDRTRASYETFLQALVGSEAGQSYDSLQWAGEAMLGLAEAALGQADDLHARRMVQQAESAEASAKDSAAAAGEVFRRVLDTYSKDPEFRKDPAAAGRLLRTRIKQAAASRLQGDFAKARQALETLMAENRTLIDPLMERGLLYEAEARAGTGTWAQAFEYWRRLSTRLGQSSSRPIEYYDANYHLAAALDKQGKRDAARQALRSVMRLSPKVGGPEMKARYEAMLARLGD